MKLNSKLVGTLLLLLAIIFSIALMFAFIELPRWLTLVLEESVGFPGFDQGSGSGEAFRTEVYIQALNLRWIGYASLIIVLMLIITGILTKKSGWALAGAFVIFLPVFGQFAISMFFLSGLGILRTVWLPFMNTAFPVMDLGQVIYIPYQVLMWFFSLFGWYAHNEISWFIMALGSFLFVWGVFVWFQSRFGSKGVATEWIYKISRHPQYLGWIIWSYGLMLFSVTENNMKKSWSVGTSLPWLISTMVIIAICMFEELYMKKKYGKEYDDYRENTPFLFPVPMWIKKVLKLPARLITRSRFPVNGKQITGIISLYTLLLIITSFFWLDTENMSQNDDNNADKKVYEIVYDINNATERKTISALFEELSDYGKNAEDVLIDFLNNSSSVIREFACNKLGQIRSQKSVITLIDLLKDEDWRVRRSCANALADIGDKRAVEPILEIVMSLPPDERSTYFSLLGSFKVSEAWPVLEEGTMHPNFYSRIIAIRAMNEINSDSALPYVYHALNDENPRVRKQMIFLLLEIQPPGAVPHLERFINDEDFETAFYAEQAIRKIESQKDNGKK